jgi:hypothetical protein
MKYIYTFLTCVFLANIAYSQAPVLEPITVTEPGENLGATTSTDPSGTTTVVIVCACSEATCFTVTRSEISGGVGNLEDNCEGEGLDNLVATNPSGINVTVTSNGNPIASGVLTNYVNAPTNGDPLKRTNTLVLQ